jgi:hypothetical protein
VQQHLADLVGRGDVEAGGGLVEEQEVGLLGETLGHEGPLALTARELAHGASGEVAEIDAIDGVAHCGPVVGPQPSDGSTHRRPAERHHLAHRHREVGRRVLGLQHVRDAPADLRRRTPEDLQRPGGGGEEAGDGVQQRRLARAVGTDEGGDAGTDREVTRLDHDAVPPGQHEALGDHHARDLVLIPIFDHGLRILPLREIDSQLVRRCGAAPRGDRMWR